MPASLVTQSEYEYLSDLMQSLLARIPLASPRAAFYYGELAINCADLLIVEDRAVRSAKRAEQRQAKKCAASVG